MEKLNLTQQKHTFTNQKECTTTQNKLKKLKPGLVVFYDIRPENGEGLFWFRRFVNLSITYLLRHLSTYVQPQDPHRANGQSNLTKRPYHGHSWMVQSYSPDCANVHAHLIHCSLCHPSPQPKCHLDWFSHFCTAHGTVV